MVTAGWMIFGIAGVLSLAVLTGIFWFHLWRLRREIRHLAAGEKVNSYRGPAIIREIYRDLCKIEARQQEIAQQIADEDFSLRAILSSMVEGVMIADKEMAIRLANQRTQAMFLLPRSPVGRTVMEVFRNHLLHDVVKRTLENGQPQFAELQIDVKEGDQFIPRHFQLTSIALQPRQGESLSGALVIFHDVTQIRSLEAVRKEFVANVSHELRTPLSIVTGYLETLLEGQTNSETAKRFLRIMEKHARRLNLLVEDLLYISQLESRKISFHYEPIHLRGCVDRVLERFETQIHHNEIQVNLAANLPVIEADPLHLEQALFNLVDNALKYGVGRPDLKVSISAECLGSEIRIKVADNGPGIPLGDQPHIFERFYRVHKDRSRDAGGTGLGLSIVKHTIQAHGGSVAIESKPGGGSTFVIRLPIR